MIITIITSMRFKKELLEQTRRLSLQGHVVLTPVVCSAEQASDFYKELMALHKEKLSLSDRAFVLNVGGYIGDGGKEEIEYCHTLNLPVWYLEDKKIRRNKYGNKHRRNIGGLTNDSCDIPIRSINK